MAKQERSGGSILQFAPFQSFVDEGFWHRLSSLKLNKFGIDDSPIAITGFYAPCSHSQVSNHLTLLSESLPSDESEQSSVPAISRGNRNRCSVPGILYNTNTLEAYHALDKKSLLKEEAKKVFCYNRPEKMELPLLVCFPCPVFDPPVTVVELKPASQWFTLEEADSVSVACNGWRNSSLTAGVPFFLVCIASNSHATIRHLKDWEACQGDGQKVLFGFYDPCHLPNNPGWPLRNFLALICSRWNLKTVHFLCYRENRGFADLGVSLVGEAVITIPQGRASQIGLAISAADLNLKLMRWRAWPSLNLDELSSTKCLLLGAGTLGCQVARMLMAWGVRKITLLDNGRVAMSNPLRQSLYTLDNCLNGGDFKAMAAVKSLKQIFPAVEAEGVVMAIPMPGHPVSSQEEESVLEDCRHLHELVESHDAVFLLTDTRESRWLPALLCANANKITITAALGFDSFLVMRHGSGPLNSSNDLKAESEIALSGDMDSLALA
ncbi:hypothetical protein GH714_003465 [Hevea brasiliensis]|uniref:Ubiquitin-like modifier-activating enzyme ATG7 n=1 Tax=Hevea brasiliensis TaxID=3981 RepID=A0A6A6LYU1_HEVBR|nr:hypothetical protein GH714_003465 [Hevea brasiliensis]